MERVVDARSEFSTPISAPLGRHLAIYLCRATGETDPAVYAALRLTCDAVEEGHVCLDLKHHAETEVPGMEMRLPRLAEWLARLGRSPLVGRPGEFKPLILEGAQRLYLARYWNYEKSLAQRLKSLAVQPGMYMDLERLRTDLDTLFTHNKIQPDLQKRAAAVAVLRRFCVISGGPGTGKTSTVVRILAALQSQAGDRPLRIALSAPTGKAAARLKQSIRQQKDRLDVPAALRDSIPEEACTLHRLLGARPDSIHFRHHRENPLPVDVLVVDEASMIDLALMAKLVDALPDWARLILLGDKDQLAAVEPGSIFGDLCRSSGYSADFCEQLRQACGEEAERGDLFVPALSDCVALLTYSHRFAGGSGIGELARLVNAGSAKAALKLLTGKSHADLVWHGAGPSQERELLERMEAGYADFFGAVQGAGSPGEVLKHLERYRVLTAHRDGLHGAGGINRRFEERLFARSRTGTRWYTGRPVIVTRNDYDLRLFNGDIGVALGRGNGLRVYFEDAEGHIRGLAPGRLPEHETVFAMTVHKSQGSEFDAIALVLPETHTPVLDRPLIYTAITRARSQVAIFGAQAVLEAAIRHLPPHSSGLRERLEND